MRIIRWTNSGYENGRIASRIGFPIRIGDIMKFVDPVRWQESAKAGRNAGLAPWALRWSRLDFYQLAVHLHRQGLPIVGPLSRAAKYGPILCRLC